MTTRAQSEERAARIVKAYQGMDKSHGAMTVLAERFGLSRAAIHRVIKRARDADASQQTTTGTPSC